MRIDKNKSPITTNESKIERRATRTNQSKKPFSVSAFVDRLWSERHLHYGRDLYTISDLVVMYCRRIGEDPDHPSKLWRVRMGRELRRVGAQQAPQRRRKTFGEEHRTMPQLWWVSDGTLPDYLSTAALAWEEYTLQRECESAAQALWNELGSSQSASEHALEQ